jgi:hypothetical protein
VSPSIVVVLLLSKMQRSGDVERVALRARLAAWRSLELSCLFLLIVFLGRAAQNSGASSFPPLHVAP